MRISDWSSDVCSSDLESLVDAIEAAFGTPVQTAVKREDEQAFARLNAENLMFCEDAARRVAAALSADERIERFDATVSHFESLHRSEPRRVGKECVGTGRSRLSTSPKQQKHSSQTNHHNTH